MTKPWHEIPCPFRAEEEPGMLDVFCRKAIRREYGGSTWRIETIRTSNRGAACPHRHATACFPGDAYAPPFRDSAAFPTNARRTPGWSEPVMQMPSRLPPGCPRGLRPLHLDAGQDNLDAWRPRCSARASRPALCLSHACAGDIANRHARPTSCSSFEERIDNLPPRALSIAPTDWNEQDGAFAESSALRFACAPLRADVVQEADDQRLAVWQRFRIHCSRQQDDAAIVDVKGIHKDQIMIGQGRHCLLCTGTASP